MSLLSALVNAFTGGDKSDPLAQEAQNLVTSLTAPSPHSSSGLGLLGSLQPSSLPNLSAGRGGFGMDV